MFREKIKDVFWGMILPSLDTLRQFIFSSEFRKLRADQVKRCETVKMCIDKASRCYKLLTGYAAPKQISMKEVEQAIFFAPNQQELLVNLRNCNFGRDEQFVLLLYMSIVNTYAPSTPVWAIEGGNVMGAYSLPDKR